MKKKILFVIPSLRSGGAEKSLISILSLLDYEKYEVDLLLFRRDGLFFDKIPEEVSYLYDTSDFEIFDGDWKKASLHFLKRLNFSAIIDRLKYRNTFNETDMVTQETKSWFYLRKRLPKIKKHYDCAIGFLEGNASNFVADCVNADRKICFVHNDIRKLPHDKGFYRNSFEKCDAVVTVSSFCLESLISEFSDLSDKFNVIENIICRKLIMSYIDESASVFDKSDDETVILTVGRCSEQKNIGLAVEVCAELKRRGRRIKWYHIGKGEMFEKVKALIDELELENDFIMLGETSNPYPYMAQCDLYVQPSRFEGKSIAIDEVKCLYRPIVVTDFPSVYDQISDGVNGIICQINKYDMADKIEMLIDGREIRDKLSNALAKGKTGNEEELQKLYRLIDG